MKWTSFFSSFARKHKKDARATRRQRAGARALPEKKTRVGLVIESTESHVHGFYDHQNDVIVFDAQKLSKLVIEVAMAIWTGERVDDNGDWKPLDPSEIMKIYVDLELVWIAKFASLVSHEIIHKVLTDLEGMETSRKFDNLHFHEFMEKIPENSIDMVLWSDALETCPIGDTWFA